MDRFWYHRLLKGAVSHAAMIETKYAGTIPELALGTAISQASPISIFGFQVSSSRKIDVFYGGGFLVLLLVGLLVLTASPDPELLREQGDCERADIEGAVILYCKEQAG
jgi:hypothetical protein